MTVRRLAVALMVAYALVACGGESPAREKAGSPSSATAGAAPSVAPSTIAGGTPGPVASGAAGAEQADRVALQLSRSRSATGSTLAAALKRMPAQLSGQRVTRTPESVTYTLPAGTATIEAMEADDVYGSTASAALKLSRQELVNRMVARQRVRLGASCPTPALPCAVGDVPDGTSVAVWAPQNSDLVLAAVAGNMADVEALVRAWTSAT